MQAGYLSIKIKKRGYAPQGGGLAIVKQQFARKIEAV
jgi:RNA 3'-terminal phosphate cyclase